MSFSPQWHAIGREGELAAEQLAAGVTILGRADHAHKGLYTQAFFSLSIGIERLAKLIVVADYLMTNGRYPTDQELRTFGHDVALLLDRCETISLQHRSGQLHAIRPNCLIHQGIVAGLSEFGVLSRYYNLDFIVGGKAAQFPEPIGAWWRRVGMPILDKHYSEAQRQKDDALANAAAIFMGPSFVLHHAEDDSPIDDLTVLMQRAMATRVVQKYGRLYTLQIIRWLAFLISDLARKACHGHNFESFFGLDELFTIFMNEDSYLVKRKTLSLYHR